MRATLAFNGLRQKQIAYDKGTLVIANTLLLEALIQSNTVNSNILG